MQQVMSSDWPTGKYGAILADPPWTFKVWSKATGNGRSAASHYDVMSLDDIKNLPLNSLAADNCVLFLWATMPMIPEALETMAAWGFTYKTVGFSWMKTCKVQTDLLHFGMGYYTRSNVELCLLGTKGSPKRQDKGVPQAILEPVREHSRKPDCVHERIERLVPGPYIELFARTKRDGWDCWGLETNKFEEELTLDI